MAKPTDVGLNRRLFVAGATAAVGAGLATRLSAQQDSSTELEGQISASVTRNVSSFRALDWRPYFSNLQNGAILCDIQSRALHYWSEDQSIYKLYPTSVPLTDDLTAAPKSRKRSWRPHGGQRLRCANATLNGPKSWQAATR